MDNENHKNSSFYFQITHRALQNFVSYAKYIRSKNFNESWQVLVYMETGNDNETKEHNKKIIEVIGQILEEREIQQKSNNSIRRLQWTPGAPRKPRREHEW